MRIKVFIIAVVLLLMFLFIVFRPHTDTLAGTTLTVPTGFQPEGTSFVKTERDNPRDRIISRIGKETADSPELTLTRWDEVSMNVRYVTADPITKTIEGNKVVYSHGKTKTEFYELAPTASLSEGGYEVNLVLTEKPSTNVFSFAVQSDNLNWYYQPELTAQEVAAGDHRPENVVGSYAVYYTNHPKNIEGEKLYRTGKAFHVYRPWVSDANGKGVWGVLAYDSGSLSVTVPQQFLNSAKYPVNVDPTFGYTTAGASSTGSTDRIRMYNAAPVSQGYASSVSAYMSTLMQGGTRVPFWQGCIYETTGNTLIPNGTTVIASASDVDNGPGTWRTNAFPIKPTVFAQTYHIGAMFNAQDVSEELLYYDAGGGQTSFVSTVTNPPCATSVTVGTGSDRSYSIYATYDKHKELPIIIDDTD